MYANVIAGGRWRCLQYWLRRGRLNLALLEQLDLIGRTAELARAFGIDFFSVLSRGSQYRVESMMVRLSHTQNYLMLSPAKEQVSPLVKVCPARVSGSMWHLQQLRVRKGEACAVIDQGTDQPSSTTVVFHVMSASVSGDDCAYVYLSLLRSITAIRLQQFCTKFVPDFTVLVARIILC